MTKEWVFYANVDTDTISLFEDINGELAPVFTNVNYQDAYEHLYDVPDTLTEALEALIWSCNDTTIVRVKEATQNDRTTALALAG